ncbi:RyR domain-containing protein [Cryobacterium melibiosiphilum]|nr:RyR domain-containing protein [Cryobacterium melibiosiphilum]
MPPPLRRRHSDWTILALDSHTRGLSASPVMARLFPFGLTLEPHAGGALSSWERAARIVHLNYRWNERVGDTFRLADWPALPLFLKQSNLRSITTALASARAIGRSWEPATGLGTSAPSDAELTAAELDEMAELEHASWCQHLRDAGWTQRDVRDDGRRRHPLLVDWAAFGDDGRARTRQTVATSMALLEALGYRSRSLWRGFARSGEVTASPADQAWDWTSAAGDTLHASAGDWLVDDGAGAPWSVKPEIFAATYAAAGPGRWRRTGQVQARPATPAETVETREGVVTAPADSWVVRGPAGDRWVTPAAHFAANYTPSVPVATRRAELKTPGRLARFRPARWSPSAG